MLFDDEDNDEFVVSTSDKFGFDRRTPNLNVPNVTNPASGIALKKINV